MPVLRSGKLNDNHRRESFSSRHFPPCKSAGQISIKKKSTFDPTLKLISHSGHANSSEASYPAPEQRSAYRTVLGKVGPIS